MVDFSWRVCLAFAGDLCRCRGRDYHGWKEEEEEEEEEEGKERIHQEGGRQEQIAVLEDKEMTATYMEISKQSRRKASKPFAAKNAGGARRSNFFLLLKFRSGQSRKNAVITRKLVAIWRRLPSWAARCRLCEWLRGQGGRSSPGQ